MRHTIYKAKNKLFATQKALAFYCGINLNTLRSRIERAGGLKEIKETTIDGVKITFITEFLY